MGNMDNETVLKVLEDMGEKYHDFIMKTMLDAMKEHGISRTEAGYASATTIIMHVTLAINVMPGDNKDEAIKFLVSRLSPESLEILKNALSAGRN